VLVVVLAPLEVVIVVDSHLAVALRVDHAQLLAINAEDPITTHATACPIQ